MACMCVAVGGQLVEVSSFLPSHGLCILNSGCESFCRARLPEFSSRSLHTGGGERTTSEVAFYSGSDAVAVCYLRAHQ